MIPPNGRHTLQLGVICSLGPKLVCKAGSARAKEQYLHP